MAKRLPKPHQRPRIDLDKPARQWLTVPAEKISKGDMVPDHGLVVETEVWRKEIGEKMWAKLIFLSGREMVYDFGTEIWAFTRGESGGERE